MKKLSISLGICCLMLFIAGIVCGEDDKAANNQKDKKSENQMTPELQAFKKELDAMSTDKLKQLLVTQKAELEQWCKKNNFHPPGMEAKGKDDGKGRYAGKGKGGKGQVAISKRKEAELMAEYIPWKEKIDLIEKTLREREKPNKEERPKKDK